MGSLPHAEQTPVATMGAEVRIQREAAAVVRDREPDRIAAVAQGKTRGPRAGMLHDVRERLQRDAEDHRLDLAVQRDRSSRDPILE
jgi:hypothetical protein